MGDLSGLSSRSIIGMFYEVLEAERNQWPFQIGMEMDSDQGSEEYKWLGMSPPMREWIGQRLAKSLRENGITIKNKTFESTLEISVDDIRRDKTGQIEIRIGELADRVIQHWASLLSTQMENGESSVCYDGQFFFDTDHSEGDSGVQSNDLVAADFSELNVVTPTNPTPDEMANIILKMIQHMYSFKDDQGEPINEGARSFVVHVPVAFWGAAMQAVTKNNLNTGSGVRENPLMGANLSIDVVSNSRLSWTDKLALFRTDGRAKPFILQTEEDLSISAIAEGTEEEFKNNRHLYGVKAIRNVGYGLWQQAMLATLS